jgi:hypothetical protein
MVLHVKSFSSFSGISERQRGLAHLGIGPFFPGRSLLRKVPFQWKRFLSILIKREMLPARKKIFLLEGNNSFPEGERIGERRST